MVQVKKNINCNTVEIPEDFLKGKRKLTQAEIKILEDNLNINQDGTWDNFYVSNEKDGFDPSLIHSSFFSGYIVLGRLENSILSYNDLHLHCGIRSSRLSNVVIGDYPAIHNVRYFDNYRIGNRVILFNIQEICCTKHSKFGNGILKEGESEDKRVWLGVANENDGRKILPFESLIPADAYIWSHYRDDSELLARFKELTEVGNTRKMDTMGFIDDDVVIKNSNIVKDVKVGKAAYIKGAFKLKNITILSSEEEVSQIGEGVEMVNGILGYGSRVFYQAIAIRFVIGRNCQVKYGARLLNSVLGDNSTVSCCEILNNLIYPFHEQHHNSSFLIATTVMGQSNIAAGATVGSNHNSRSPDGEIFAKRGFWPGLCSDFKHNSRFASFSLISKGSYQYELDIPYPFSLITPGQGDNQAITIIPAWWFMYDMFAIARNKNKFTKRDKRKIKIQHIETDPMAPDTMQETILAIDRLINLTSVYLQETNNKVMEGLKDSAVIYQTAKDFLHQNPDSVISFIDMPCQKKYGAVILKPVKAYKTYRKILKYYATKTIYEYIESNHIEEKHLSEYTLFKIRKIPLYTDWENAGGQIIPSAKIQELFVKIKDKTINTWDEVHAFYDECQNHYDEYKTRHALYILEQLYSRPLEEFDEEIFRNIIDDVSVCAYDLYNDAMRSREKDYTDYYRTMVYRSRQEMDSVIGPFEDNSFLKNMGQETLEFVEHIRGLFEYASSNSSKWLFKSKK